MRVHSFLFRPQRPDAGIFHLNKYPLIIQNSRSLILSIFS